ncbi:MAG: T9SS type A sorting domain-containing protein, partial [Saprospiraceae bacterium]|nr:T9SS type A sorting domain-containing protein [Saprospiraceae bacterium]
SFECRPSTFVGNYLMKQRGTNDFIVAFARQDEDGLYSRFCNFDLDFINYMGHQYKINVFSSDNNCNAISRKEMFKNWIFYHKFGSASVLEWDKTRDFIVVPEIQDPKINSAIYGYDFCLDDRTDYIGGEIDYLIKPVEGLGVAINLSASADGLERTGKLYLKYWRYGAEWIDGSAISIITFPGVKLNHPGIEQINDTTWQLKLDEIDLFTNYQEELTMDYSAVAGDSLFFQAIITPEMAAPVGMLRSRVYQMPEVREESINVSVQNTSRMDDFIHQGDRILYTLSYTNNSPDTVRDLRFYNALSGTSYESFAPEISSLPIDTRSIGEGLGNSIDISVPNIDLIPGQSFFATFSINPSNVNCGREIKNSITTVVNYQHLDTTLIQIKYRGVGREETLDTFLSIGAEFNGMKISGDTMLTKIISNENGCDTILHYNIHTSTVATEESSFDGTRIYPNPFQHAFTIDEVEGRIKSIKIYDVHGKEIPFQKFDNNRISIDGHSQGILLVRIIRADGTMYWSRMLKL